MLQCKQLKKSFGSLEVLKGINLQVDEREVVVLVGASGSGKSTLLRCFNFLEEIDGGEILIDGEKIDSSKVDLTNTSSSRDGISAF
jgi:polar amino acid transport system ATP-binding protein